MAREIRLQYRWVSPHKSPRQAALSSSQLTFDSWEQQGGGGEGGRLEGGEGLGTGQGLIWAEKGGRRPSPKYGRQLSPDGRPEWSEYIVVPAPPPRPALVC